MSKYHPDNNKSIDTEEELKALIKGYEEEMKLESEYKNKKKESLKKS